MINLPISRYVVSSGYTWLRAPRSAAALLALSIVLGCGDGISRPDAYGRASLTRGAKLFDNWQEVTGVTPAGDNPNYSLTKGTAKGAATWRCKECHGIDYRGVDGLYASGSHFTGVKGLLQAAGADPKTLFDAMRGQCLGPTSVSAGSQLSDADVMDLAKFVREGVVDLTQYLDATAVGVPLAGDAAVGKVLYDDQCARCHGVGGTSLNIDGTPGHYVGTEATKNGYNLQHRIRFGLAAVPGTLKQEMPAAVNFGWSMQDVMDVIVYSRTLPVK